MVIVELDPVSDRVASGSSTAGIEPGTIDETLLPMV